MSETRDDPPFPLPVLAGAPDADGWVLEESRYRIRPRPKPKFRSVLPSAAFFGGGDGQGTVRMRARPDAREGERCYEVSTLQRLGDITVEETLTCVRLRGGIVADRLERTVGEGRQEIVQFRGGPFPWPDPTYPEVMLPFLLRGAPHDGERRALYSWTNDRFVARVYVESRGQPSDVDVPAGKLSAYECWMYPDLNDWIALGRVVTKLAKPLLPRYDIHFEAAAPNRVVRFEGPYGPPGAPEVILELM